MKLFYCEALSATISEKQCHKNKRRSKLFYDNQTEYFQPGHLQDKNKERSLALKNKHWGFWGSSAHFSPLNKKCFECEKTERG